MLPLFITSEWQHEHPWTGPGRQQFLCECLQSLSHNLNHLDSGLCFRKGPQVETLIKLALETGAKAIFFNQDPDPYGKQVEKKLVLEAKKHGIKVHAYHDLSLHAPGECLKKDGTPYRVYTPYFNRWIELEKPRSSQRLKLPPLIPNVEMGSPPELSHWGLTLPKNHHALPGGEKAAKKRLKQAVTRVPYYLAKRDHPAAEGTSRISQDLRWGTLSIRKVYETISTAAQSDLKNHSSYHTFLKEIAWREFYLQILDHFPEVLTKEFQSVYYNLPWQFEETYWKAWTSGQTGFPIIDAGIRELLQTGHMHNRVRMIVAMFLTKDLHIDWRHGEQFFNQHLIDGEIASNNGGWQWSAGTGADAAPYFRIQNPWTQTKKFDPQGDYIKQWVPELQEATPRQLFTDPGGGISVHPGYTPTIVDHNTERLKTLSIFQTHREALM